VKLVAALAGIVVVLVAVPTLLVVAAVGVFPWLGAAYLVKPPTVTQIPPAIVGGVPEAQWPLIQAAAQTSECGVSPEVLAAIANIESGFGANMSTNASGHFGFGQFDAATWAAYGSGDPNNPRDALAAISRVLCARGYGTKPDVALNSYGGCTTSPCLSHPGILPSFVGTYAGLVHALAGGLHLGTDVVALVLPWVGKTAYVFGGTAPTGWDCSGLVQWAYAQIGVHLDRTAVAQYAASQHIADSDLQPGDIVAFSNTYMPGVSHIGIYAGNGMMVNAADEKTGTVLIPVFDHGYWQAHYTGAGRIKR